MAAIKFDYNQTMNQAKLLDELANDMQNKCIKKLGEISDNVGAAWTGNASKAYVKYVSGLQEDYTKKAKYIRDTAEFLRNAAKKLKAADDAAKQATQNI